MVVMPVMRLTDNQGHGGAAQAAGARTGVQPCTTAEDHVRVRVDCLRRRVAPRVPVHAAGTGLVPVRRIRFMMRRIPW